MVQSEKVRQEFSQRLAQACRKAGLDEHGRGMAIARALKLSSKGVSKWLNAESLPRQEKMNALATFLNVDVVWLQHGKESLKTPEDKESTIPPEEEWEHVDAWDSDTPLPPDEVEAPFLRDIALAAGDGSLSEEDYNGFKLRFSKATLRRVGANTNGSGVLCFPAKGNSMEPVIPDGATVAVDIDNKTIIDGEIYAINQGGLKRIKQLYLMPGDKIRIRSFNRDEYPDEESLVSDVEIIGFVFWYSVIRYRR